MSVVVENLMGTHTGTGIACFEDLPSHFVWFSSQGGEGNWVTINFRCAPKHPSPSFFPELSAAPCSRVDRSLSPDSGTRASRRYLHSRCG